MIRVDDNSVIIKGSGYNTMIEILALLGSFKKGAVIESILNEINGMNEFLDEILKQDADFGEFNEKMRKIFTHLKDACDIAETLGISDTINKVAIDESKNKNTQTVKGNKGEITNE